MQKINDVFADLLISSPLVTTLLNLQNVHLYIDTIPEHILTHILRIFQDRTMEICI